MSTSFHHIMYIETKPKILFEVLENPFVQHLWNNMYQLHNENFAQERKKKVVHIWGKAYSFSYCMLLWVN